jgi:hypothetical protein
MVEPVSKEKVKEYAVPEEVIILFVDAEALLGLRDQYAKNDNGFRKSKKVAKEANRLFTKFWRKTMAMYPELQGKPLIVNKHKNCVIVRPMTQQPLPIRR